MALFSPSCFRIRSCAILSRFLFLPASPSRIRCGSYNYGETAKLPLLSAIKLFAIYLVNKRVIHDVLTDLL